MNDWHISLETILQLGGLVIGVAVTLATLKVSLKVVVDKVKELQTEQEADRKKNEDQHKENQAAIRSVERQVERECLKKDDFREFEGRLREQIGQIDHSVRNATGKAVGQILDILKVAGVVSPRTRTPSLSEDDR